MKTVIRRKQIDSILNVKDKDKDEKSWGITFQTSGRSPRIFPGGRTYCRMNQFDEESQELIRDFKLETMNNIPARQDMTYELSDRNVSPTDEKIRTFITDRGNVYEIVSIIVYAGDRDMGRVLAKKMKIPDDKDWKMFDMPVNDKERMKCLCKKVGEELFHISVDPMENECDREAIQDLEQGLESENNLTVYDR